MRDSEATKILADQAKNGDRAAFDELVARFRDRLTGRIERWSQFQLGPQLDVEEVLQDTFIRALSALRRFQWEDEEAFFGWLCTIGKHALADAARRARREAVRQRRVESVGGLSASGLTPSRILGRVERFDRLEVAVRQLSPTYRQVLLLSRIEGLTVKEIATRIGRSPDSVKHLIARALQQLRKHFGDTESLRLADRCLDAGDETNGK